MSESLPRELSGMLLAASPLLRDPNFRETILFLSNHSREDGAMGFILNRPVGKTLELPGEEGPVEAKLFIGGPVQPESLIVASLQWRPQGGVVAFRVMTDKVEAAWVRGLRAFAGYAGWSPGQLERELAEKAWLVLPPTQELIEMPNPATAWRQVMRSAPPFFRLLAEAPEDPSLN